MSTLEVPRSVWMLRALLRARFHFAGSASLTWITTRLRCAAPCGVWALAAPAHKHSVDARSAAANKSEYLTTMFSPDVGSRRHVSADAPKRPIIGVLAAFCAALVTSGGARLRYARADR